MTPVQFSAACERDFREITNYIAKDNPRRALSFVREMRQRCKSLGQFPKAARAIAVHGKELRVLPFKRYIVVYRIGESGVTIERVWHGARDIWNLLDATFKEE
jgi:toxin ParE1/3/4